MFNVDKVVPQSDGSTSKVKVKLRVNLHGIFNVSSATMLERPEPTAPEPEPMEPVAMERENGPEAEAAVGAGENDLAGVSADAPPNGEKAAESEEVGGATRWRRQELAAAVRAIVARNFDVAANVLI